MAVATLCPRCNAPSQPDRPGCGVCGLPLVGGVFLSPDAAPITLAPQAMAPPRPTVLQRPLWLVTLLTLATFGLYYNVWIGLTWAELKRVTDDSRLHPFFHLVKQLIPVYGLFAVGAHFGLVHGLLREHGRRSRLNGASAVGLVMASAIAARVALQLHTSLSWLAFVAVAAIAAFIVHRGQADLNDLWRQRGITAEPRPPHPLEWVTLALFAAFAAMCGLGALIEGMGWTDATVLSTD